MQQARAILMDVDGTLLDSCDAQTRSWLRVLHQFGYRVEYRQIRARIGMGPDRILRELCGLSRASLRGRRMLRVRESLLRERLLPHITPFARVPEFLDFAQARDVKLALVTACARSEALALLGAAQLLTAFDHVVCSEDVAQSKPAQDGVRAALDVMGVRPDQSLFLGSSPYDLAAARAARVPCVALRSGGWPESALLGCEHVYDGIGQLLDRLQRPPLVMNTKELSALSPFVWSEVSGPTEPREHLRTERPHAA